jgi:hypothetical protein
MGLTVRTVARLTKPGRYLDSNGLYLQAISPTIGPGCYGMS